MAKVLKRKVARKAKAFDARVIAVSRSGKAGGDVAQVFRRERIGERRAITARELHERFDVAGVGCPHGHAVRKPPAVASVRTAVRAEMLGRVASEFDRVHDIHRAVAVGSVDAVIPAARLRPEIIAKIKHRRAWKKQRANAAVGGGEQQTCLDGDRDGTPQRALHGRIVTKAKDQRRHGKGYPAAERLLDDPEQPSTIHQLLQDTGAQRHRQRRQRHHDGVDPIDAIDAGHHQHENA